MEIKGKITIFPEHVTFEENGEQKERVIIRSTISSKTEKGDYINKSVAVKLAEKAFPKEKVNMLKDNECYQLEVESGFLGVDMYTNKKGEIRRDLVLVVTGGKLVGHKKYEKKIVTEVVDEDLPF